MFRIPQPLKKKRQLAAESSKTQSCAMLAYIKAVHCVLTGFGHIFRECKAVHKVVI